MKNKGFTLIELVSVVVLLGIVAVISVPVVKNITKDAKQKVLDKQINSVLESAKNWAIKNTDLLPETGESTLVKIDTLKKEGFLENKEIINPVDKSEMNGCTEIKYNADFNQYEYLYQTKCTSFSELSRLATTSKELGVNTIDRCIENGNVCPLGTAFAIKVNDTDVYKFYVISDDGEELTLMMSKNLGSKVAWINETDYVTEDAKDEVPNTCHHSVCVDEGPITAINYLHELTDEEWSNIALKTYTYNGLSATGDKRFYEDITRTMRARMIARKEFDAIAKANAEGVPTYMLDGGAMYWTTTAYSDYMACYVNEGELTYGAVDVSSGRRYIRPVIELSKLATIY